MTKFKWPQVVLIGLLWTWFFIPVVSNYGGVTPQARLTPMTSTHYHWSQTFGGSEYEEGTAIVETADGGFAISGRTASFGEVLGTDEVWLVRCDENGTHLWNQTYGGGMIRGGAMDAFYKSVRLEGLTDGGFLISSHTANYSVGDADGWLIRTDADGNHLWNYTYGGPDDEYFVDSVECSDGGFISAGFTQNETVGNVDGWLIRTDADGNHLWNCTYGGPTFGEVVYDIIEVSTGGFLLTGWIGDFEYVENPNDFEGVTSCWIVRVDAFGTPLWDQTYGTDHLGTSAIECQDGGFAFIGSIGNRSERIFDVILVRINVNGDHLWNQTYGDDDIEAAYEFAECSDGGFAIFTLNWINSANSDAWFIRTNENGITRWSQTYGGNYFDQFWSGIIASNGDFVAVGKTHSFGPGDGAMWVVRIPDEFPVGPGPLPLPWIRIMVGVSIAVIVVIIVFYLYRER